MENKQKNHTHISSAPAISVLITCYNQGEYLSQCIESVLEQNFTDYEIILVDNASTDNTKHIAQSYPKVHYVFESKQGVGYARNAALHAARGSYMAFLDSDDYWPVDRLATLYPLAQQLFEKNSIPYGKVYNFFHGDSVTKMPLAHIMRRNSRGEIHSTSIIHESFFEQIGIFNESLLYGEDTDLNVRLTQCGITFVEHDILVLYRRLHGTNLSLTARSLEDVAPQLLSKYRKLHTLR